MVNVVIVGQGYWGQELSQTIERHGSGALRVAAVVGDKQKALSLRQMWAVARADVLLRVGYRPGIASRKGVIFDLAWQVMRILKPRARVVYYWIGTDVTEAQEFMPTATGLRKWFWNRAARDQHICGAPWFVQELAGAGIRARYVCFPWTAHVPPEPTALPETFRVLCYIPDHRHVFYNGGSTYEAAQRLPQVQFDVVGGVGTWVDKPLENLTFHGWQEDLTGFYRGCAVVLRLVAHDAISGFVRQGLLYCRHVIYTYSLPHTMTVSLGDSDRVCGLISELHQMHATGSLEPNIEGYEYAREAFSEARLGADLVNVLREIAQSGSRWAP